MGKVIIDVVSGYKRVYRPTTCEECPIHVCDDTGWCLYYKRRADERGKPEFCKVVAITIEEGD